jgi:hypothetical protein
LVSLFKVTDRQRDQVCGGILGWKRSTRLIGFLITWFKLSIVFLTGMKIQMPNVPSQFLD